MCFLEKLNTDESLEASFLTQIGLDEAAEEIVILAEDEDPEVWEQLCTPPDELDLDADPALDDLLQEKTVMGDKATIILHLSDGMKVEYDFNL